MVTPVADRGWNLCLVLLDCWTSAMFMHSSAVSKRFRQSLTTEFGVSFVYSLLPRISPLTSISCHSFKVRPLILQTSEIPHFFWVLASQAPVKSCSQVKILVKGGLLIHYHNLFLRVNVSGFPLGFLIVGLYFIQSWKLPVEQLLQHYQRQNLKTPLKINSCCFLYAICNPAYCSSVSIHHILCFHS